VIDVERTFVVAKPIDVVVGYLKDFANAEQWDPGTKSCTQETPGPVQVGTTWHNVSEIKGHETELAYRLEELSPNHIKFVGENKGATSIDEMTFAAAGSGTSITYHSHVEFHGVAKLAGPFLKGEFKELGVTTERQITEAINAL
jgi:carbon monoxide dehydrogenase subunit G